MREVFLSLDPKLTGSFVNNVNFVLAVTKFTRMEGRFRLMMTGS